MQTRENLELLEMVHEDLLHIGREALPTCDDHQLRRISVQLRNLLIEDRLIQVWRVLRLTPKQPTIIAPRLYTDGLDHNAIAVAGGAEITGAAIGGVKFMPGVALSDKDVKALYENEKGSMEFPFQLSDYKDSISIFAEGKAIKRRQVIAFVAHKKGGAHLDTSRKKDEEVYMILDRIFDAFTLGGTALVDNGVKKVVGGKNPIYAELMSVAQCIVKSPDILRLAAEIKKNLDR